MHSIGHAQGPGPGDPQPQEAAPPAVTPVRRSVPETLADAALAGMLGVLNGQLPLKHARAAHALGELSLRSRIAHHEYEERPAFLLPHPHTSGGAVNELPGTSREA